MPRRTGISLPILAAATLAGCATDRFERLQAEFAEVSANCRLSGVALLRDATDRRLLHLVFRHRNNMELQARQDGRLACAEHWARERGYGVTTSPRNTVDH
jgi:hypothetical protein